MPSKTGTQVKQKSTLVAKSSLEKPKLLRKTIPLDVFDRVIHVFITPNNNVVDSVLNMYGITLEDDQICDRGMEMSFPPGITKKVKSFKRHPITSVHINPDMPEYMLHGTIAHESYHAATRVLESLTDDKSDGGEEVTAYLISHIAEEIEKTLTQYRRM